MNLVNQTADNATDHVVGHGANHLADKAEKARKATRTPVDGANADGDLGDEGGDLDVNVGDNRQGELDDGVGNGEGNIDKKLDLGRNGGADLW